MTFGSRSERLSGQALLFTEDLPIPPTPPKLPTTTVAAHERKRRGRPALPGHLPRIRKEYDLTDEQKAQFNQIAFLGEVMSYTLDVIPQKVFVIDHPRAKYRCTKDGITSIAEKLAVLMPVLKAHMLGATVLFADDTTLKLVEDGRRRSRTARLWVYVSSGAKQNPKENWIAYPKAAYFEFTETRWAIHPTRFLNGYRGFVQADDYSGYHPTFATELAEHCLCLRNDGCGCWSRRGYGSRSPGSPGSSRICRSPSRIGSIPSPARACR